MQYISRYHTPLGRILLACDELGLTGLWFEQQKYFARQLDPEHEERDHPHFDAAKRWLECYFAGRKPDFTPQLHMTGSPFQLAVWEILCEIPYGSVTTYGGIAREIARKTAVSRMSAQAVGGAVGHNKLSIIVPCHRVVGSNGSLTGYAGGIQRKIKLLSLEGVTMDGLSVPERGTALL